MKLPPQKNLILHNFFAFSGDDIQQFLEIFEASFSQIKKGDLNSLLFQNSINLDTQPTQDALFQIQSRILQGEGAGIFSDLERVRKLTSMSIYYKKIQLWTKQISGIMADFSVDKMAMFTRYRFDSPSFLAFRQEELDERHILMRDWSRDLKILKNLKSEFSQNHFYLSEISKQSLVQIVDFMITYSDNVIKTVNWLRGNWEKENQHFLNLTKNEETLLFNDSLDFFKQGGLMDSILNNFSSEENQCLEEFNEFIKE